MPLARRAPDVDTELGKKFDDAHVQEARPNHRKPSLFTWRPRRRRRLLLFIVGAYLLYLFYKNIPTDLRPAVERYDPRFAKPQPFQHAAQDDSTTSDDGAGQDYKGRLKFPWLSTTLYHARAATKGIDNSVLFAAADLYSVSDLIPLACEMARRRTNTVHFVLGGRDRVTIEGIQHVNGISNGDCPIFWHDAHLDHSSASAEERLETGMVVSADYIDAFLRPKAIITHDDNFEENYFYNAIRQSANWRGTTLISLPTKALDFIWLSRLDSSSLKAWNDVHVDMLVHAPTDSSGSLIRLLRSLEKADYLGSKPSLAIEMPFQTDPFLLEFVRTTASNEHFPVYTTLRRRVAPGMTPIQSTVRTVEAFYPKDSAGSHLLLLSPQAELSPSFYHYLKYTILRYRHSVHAVNESSNLLGVSLELPARKPTDDSLLSIPTESDTPFFKWQAPNSNAALYFGDKWAELHTFLASCLAAAARSKVEAREKLISTKYPSFMEELFELMRVKGYYMLYPSFPLTQGFSLATIHNDLYQPPEEFQVGSSPSDHQWDNYLQELRVTPVEDLNIELGSVERPLSRHPTINPLFQRLPLQVPELDTLPLLSFKGETTSPENFDANTKAFARKFSTSVGGCNEVPARLVQENENEPYNIDDLFCLDFH
ncbi:hypothetical protein BGW36DRAFT_421686 [Talaromyces proteolyticus]|uniref:Uncharacterized protein n=1 Tax=Talaromyces proteolyticus TaxID=1131652 RepID=A0AAD4Q3J8_9EURO|nr:uncharacterized protein BGW36DRAFT_421686 [Talaromyces proteolyticus]KAH8705114.1 hypothetical protein BGW36DRAFT_421686 [Talaromyces proteolyticus]